MAETAQDRVFVYGTLLAPDILSHIISLAERPHSLSLNVPNRVLLTHSVLYGYQRRKVLGRDYAGIIPADPSCHVRGVAITNLTREELGAIRFYAGSQFERRNVKIKMLFVPGSDGMTPGLTMPDDSGIWVNMETFVWKDPATLENLSWDLRSLFASQRYHPFFKMIQLWGSLSFFPSRQHPTSASQIDHPSQTSAVSGPSSDRDESGAPRSGSGRGHGPATARGRGSDSTNHQSSSTLSTGSFARLNLNDHTTATGPPDRNTITSPSRPSARGAAAARSTAGAPPPQTQVPTPLGEGQASLRVGNSAPTNHRLATSAHPPTLTASGQTRTRPRTSTAVPAAGSSNQNASSDPNPDPDPTRTASAR